MRAGAHAGTEHLETDYVAGYDAKTGLDLKGALALFRRHGLGVDATLVDLGCGTGLLAAAAAPEAGRVVGVDPSPAMLEVARRRSDEVEWVEAGFLTYEHEGDPPQLVHSRNALHHLSDFWKGVALRRVAAVLRPGGVLRLRDLVYDFDPGEAGAVVEAWLGGAVARSEDGWTRDELATHVREEHSTFTWLLGPMLGRAGFEVREATAAPSRTYAAYTCVRY